MQKASNKARLLEGIGMMMHNSNTPLPSLDAEDEEEEKVGRGGGRGGGKGLLLMRARKLALDGGNGSGGVCEELVRGGGSGNRLSADNWNDGFIDAWSNSDGCDTVRSNSSRGSRNSSANVSGSGNSNSSNSGGGNAQSDLNESGSRPVAWGGVAESDPNHRYHHHLSQQSTNSTSKHLNIHAPSITPAIFSDHHHQHYPHAGEWPQEEEEVKEENQTRDLPSWP